MRALLNYKKERPEEFYASLISANFDAIRDYFLHHSYTHKNPWICSSYLFELRSVMEKTNLLNPHFDIEYCREYINEARKRLNLPPLLIQKNTKTVRCIIQ